jgi:hypothetical protein
MMERRFSESSTGEPFDVDDLALLSSGKKGESTVSIDSRESPAESSHEENPNAAFSYWRNSAYLYASHLYLLDRRKDHRTSIQTASSREIEAPQLEKEFGTIQELKHSQHKPDSEKDRPVSSRLRSRETQVLASRKHKVVKPTRKSTTGSKASKRIEKSQKQAPKRKKSSFKNEKS